MNKLQEVVVAAAVLTTKMEMMMQNIAGRAHVLHRKAAFRLVVLLGQLTEGGAQISPRC